MDLDELKTTLRENIDRTVAVTFRDGAISEVTPLTVDDEGFVYRMMIESGEFPTIRMITPITQPQDSLFWTRFEDVVLIERQHDSTFGE